MLGSSFSVNHFLNKYTKIDERKLIYEFELSGNLVYVPAYDEASTVTQQIKKLGHKIILMTSRNYILGQKVIDDTVKSLKLNDIAYDDIVFTDDKLYVIKNYFPVLCFTDDNIEVARTLQKGGVITFLIDRNNIYKNIEDIRKISTLDELLYKLIKRR